MQIDDIAFGVTDWAALPRSEHPGESGTAYWRGCRFGALRGSMVEYSPGYLAGHWCRKGHVLLCLEGELHTELEDGRVFVLEAGMSYRVAAAGAHRSSTPSGARLFVVN